MSEQTGGTVQSPSYGENKLTPGCECRPSNVLYWELSEADTTGCPVHGSQSGRGDR